MTDSAAYGCMRSPTGLRCILGSAQAVPQARCAHRKGMGLTGVKTECVLAQPCVCSLKRKMHAFSKDVLAVEEKFAFSLKLPG